MKRPLIIAASALAVGLAAIMSVQAFAPSAAQSTATQVAGVEPGYRPG
jgi:hypothetical protein